MRRKADGSYCLELKRAGLPALMMGSRALSDQIVTLTTIDPTALPVVALIVALPFATASTQMDVVGSPR